MVDASGSDPPVSLEAFARTSALLRAHGEASAPAPEAAVLASLGLDAATWDDIGRHWNACIEADVAGGHTDRARSFARAFRSEHERLAREGLPALPSAGEPRAGEAAPAVTAVAVGVVAVAAAAGPPPGEGRAGPGKVIAVRGVPDAAIDQTSTDLRVLGPELPFAQGAAPSAAFAGDLQAGASGAARRVVPGSEMGETEVVQLSDFQLGGPATPFAARRAPNAGDAAIDQTTTDLRALGPVVPFGAAGAEPTPQFAAELRAAAPSASSAVASAPASTAPLTLEQYASLRAELATAPARKAEILVRYRLLDAAALERLEAAWEEQFASTPDARRRFEGLVGDFVLHLRGERR